MDQRLAGRCALVTGAGSGIGRATTLRLLAEGASVYGVGRTKAALDQTCDLATEEGLGHRLSTAVMDVADAGATERAIAEFTAETAQLDILVNAAGILRMTHTHQTTCEQWHEVLRVNLTGAFIVTRTALPWLLERGGVIINVTSTAADFGHPYMAAYAASKGGLKAFTQTLALEYHKQGLRAVCISPGGIRSAMSDEPRYPDDVDRPLLSRLRPIIGAGFGQPEQVAAAIALVAGDEGGFITGTELRIDGGAHL